MKRDRNYLINFYNATSTDDGKGEIETYEAWLERQLLSRIEKIERLEADNPSLPSKEQVNGLIYEKADSFCTDSSDRMVFRFKPKEFHELVSEILSLSPVEGKEERVWDCSKCGYRLTEIEFMSVKYDYKCPRCETSFNLFDSHHIQNNAIKDNNAGQSDEKRLTDIVICDYAYALAEPHNNPDDCSTAESLIQKGIEFARDFYEGKNKTKG